VLPESLDPSVILLRIIFNAEALAPGFLPHFPQSFRHVRNANALDNAGDAVDHKDGEGVGLIPPLDALFPFDGFVTGGVENQLVDYRRGLEAYKSHHHGFALVDEVPGHDLGLPYNLFLFFGRFAHVDDYEPLPGIQLFEPGALGSGGEAGMVQEPIARV
jgi:hypothetical protein